MAGETRASGSGLYDWWSRHPRALDVVYALAFLGREGRFRASSLDELDLAAGERVLEVGCGRGNSLAPLREAVGPAGGVVGLDVSERMVGAARRRIEEADWANVSVLRGDARRRVDLRRLRPERGVSASQSVRSRAPRDHSASRTAFR